jgi:Tol biopolymer transport system component
MLEILSHSRVLPALVPLAAFFVIFLGLGSAGPAQSEQVTDLKSFDGRSDVGKVRIPGSAEFDFPTKTLRMTASGANIWDKEDAFYFVWRTVFSADLAMTAEVDFVGEGKNPHRKAGWMVRQSLDADAPYAGVAVHGDGLIILHWRETKGGITKEVKAVPKHPASVKLERHGDVFSLSIAKQGQEYQPVGAVSVKLGDEVVSGLFLCSHEADLTETANFRNISLRVRGILPKEKRSQVTSLEVVTIDTGERKVVYRERDRFEAPNWSRDGRLFYINRGGSLYTLPVAGGTPSKLDTGDANQCNNDHGLSPDGKWLAISHNIKNSSQISIVPSSGGTPRRLTFANEPSYWHSWSPDGKTLAYCAQRNKEFDIYTIPVEGGEEKRLTTAAGLDDGPDYTPDGKHIYFNSDRTGDMKIWRMKADGSEQQQVTKDPNYADWFPHPSPDGKSLVWLSYDKSVTGHPANKDVVLRLMPLAGGKTRVLATLFGGQGTINVPSWSPDSRQIAFVSYLQVLP